MISSGISNHFFDIDDKSFDIEDGKKIFLEDPQSRLLILHVFFDIKMKTLLLAW
jgi:hypothetical protein